MLAMKELRQRRVDLKMTFDEFHSIWMLQKLKKRKRMENFEIQGLREIVKENKEDVVEIFETKFREIRIEGKRKSLNSSSTMYIETLSKTYYTEAEQKEIETMYMGGESEARKRFQGNCSFSQHRSQSQDGRSRSLSRSRYDSTSRYNQDNRSRYDRFKSPRGGGESRYNHDNR